MSEQPEQHVMAMGEYRSHLRALDRLAALALQEARRLGSIAVGPPHLVLAILVSGESVAAQALRDCGIARDAVEEFVRSYAGEGESLGDGPQFNPAAMHMQYLAEGLAAGLGEREVRDEHLLLAFLWNPNASEWPLSQLGTSREAVRDRLAALGISVPGDLPAADPRRYGPDIDVSLAELRILLHELWYVLPQGASFAWNRDAEKGWISLTEGLEPAAYIEAALERHRRGHPTDAADASTP